ncbi:MAG: LUD domain-containing protein [Pirellulaceae bacterium]|nr:LUD domain-containing protein [Pirellulaceae bacterium]
MNTRDTILQQLRRQITPSVAYPNVIDGPWITYHDPVAKFSEMVRTAGGECQSVANVAEICMILDAQEQYRAAQQVYSGVPGISGNMNMASVDQPHELERLDFVILPGQLGVAENGAIWVTDQDLRHRVCLFITQFLVLVVSAEHIVHNMHQAYQLARPGSPGFGLFVAGPSKTADIEQSLVIGAHGCRQLQVFVI